jgi:hypothetical protein
VLLIGRLLLLSASALPVKLGDLDEDGRATVLDMVRLANHLDGTTLLSSDLVLFADMNQDGILNDADASALANAILGRVPLPDPPDSDGDGLPDPFEILLGLDPHNPDTNGNGILDGDEDSDGDGLKNRWEARYGYDPSRRKTPEAVAPGFPDENALDDGLRDPDLDWLNNLAEQARGTHPRSSDSDGDGWDDASEIADGTNPLDRNSGPVFRFVISAPDAFYVNVVPPDVTLPTNVTSVATSAAMSYLNTLPEAPPANQTLVAFTASPLASYLNAIGAAPPDPPLTITWFANSAAVSYLNTLPEAPPANLTVARFSVSPFVSYLNAIPEVPPVPPTNITWFATSPIVSFRYQLP